MAYGLEEGQAGCLGWQHNSQARVEEFWSSIRQRSSEKSSFAISHRGTGMSFHFFYGFIFNWHCPTSLVGATQLYLNPGLSPVELRSDVKVDWQVSLLGGGLSQVIERR